MDGRRLHITFMDVTGDQSCRYNSERVLVEVVGWEYKGPGVFCIPLLAVISALCTAVKGTNVQIPRGDPNARNKSLLDYKSTRINIYRS